VTHGSSLQLNCETDAHPEASVSWYFSKGNAAALELIDFRKSSLPIERMNESSEGSYECRAHNAVGRVKRSFNVVDVPKGMPDIIIEQNVVLANETETIEVVCACRNCLPIKSYSWGSENLVNFKQQVIKDELNDSFQLTMTIQNARESDSGSYKCQLSNDAKEVTNDVELLVQTKPRIDSIVLKIDDSLDEIGEVVSVLDGKRIEFDCIADGQPLPDITWHKDQKELNQNDSLLIIEAVQKHHEGFYKCAVRNLLGFTAKGFQLDVKVPPKASLSYQPFMKVAEGEQVKLNCDISGSPTPNISWWLNETPLASNAKYSIIGNSLEFKNALTDSGMYSCMGTNGFGTASINFTILAMSKCNCFGMRNCFISAFRHSENLTAK